MQRRIINIAVDETNGGITVDRNSFNLVCDITLKVQGDSKVLDRVVK
jgi:hypothetical protein